MKTPLKKIVEMDFFDLEGKLCAEVGVEVGEFSKKIFECNPKELYLIDCWEHQEADTYWDDSANVSNKQHKLNYNKVCNMFKNNKNVHILKSYSSDAVERFDDEFFDFVYIDANHNYDAVYTDIKSWYPKIKKSGLLAGHDIGRRVGIKYRRPVKKAVNDFCKENNVDWFLLTRSSWGILKG